MLSLPADVTALLSRSHGVTARLLASVNGSSFSYPVAFESGSVPVDGGSPIRRTLTAQVAAAVDDPEVDVFGTELRAEYGIIAVNGTTTWVPAGVFVLTDATETGDGIVTVKGQDRWRRVVNARFLRPVVTSGNTATAIKTLVEDADSRIVCTDLTGSTATHRRSVWERDRDKAVLDLARSIGAVVVFNADGNAEIRPVPTLTAPIAWKVYGGDGGVLIEARRGATQDQTYNAVVAEGEAPDGAAAVRAVVTLTGRSTLRYGGPFGSRPRYYRSPLLRTQQQANTAAAALLARVTGVARSVELSAAPHPGLDAGDVIEVEVEPAVYERHLVESFDLPLGPGGISIATRTTQETPGE